MNASVLIQLVFLFSMNSMLFGSGNDISPPFKSEGEGPDFYLDYANYQGVDDLTHVEFYFQVDYHALQFVKDDDHFQASYSLTFEVRDDFGELIESFHNEDQFQVQTFDQTVSLSKARAMMVGYNLAPGKYRITAIMRDHETQKSSRIGRSIIVKHFRTDRLQVSDIQFSQKIKRASEGHFVKNQRYVEPNALRTFDENLSDIYIYFEIYNLTYFETRDNYFYDCDFLIENRDGTTIKTFEQAHRIPGQSSAHSIKIPAGNLPDGRYTLRIVVTDQATATKAETSQSFTVLDETMTLADYYEKP